MKPEVDKDQIRLEPLLILTLVLLIGAAFDQGVFQEYIAQTGAMAGLCLLHLALMGWVPELGRYAVRLIRKVTPDRTATVSQSDFAFPLEELEFARRAAEPAMEEATRTELPIWTSGQCLSGASPATVQLSRF